MTLPSLSTKNAAPDSPGRNRAKLSPSRRSETSTATTHRDLPWPGTATASTTRGTGFDSASGRT